MMNRRTLFAIACAVASLPLFAAPSTANSEAEAWVRGELAAGRVAELATNFPDRKDRALSARFVEELLANPPGSATRRHHRLAIRNGVVADTLDLSNRIIDDELWLQAFEFEAPVRLVNTTFRRHVLFSDSAFQASANFSEMKAERSLFLERVEFAGPTNLGNARVSGSLYVGGSKFSDTGSTPSFNSMKVDDAMFMRGAEFSGPLDFRHVRIAGSLDAQGMKFTSETGETDFNSTVVLGPIFLQGTRFAGPVNLGHMKVSANLEANDTKFTSTTGAVVFNSTEVGGAIFLNDAEFSGPADFGHMKVMGSFDASQAKFTSVDGEVNFNTTEVLGPLFLKGAEFAGPTNFIRMKVSENLEASDAKFTNATTRAKFNTIEVGGIFFLERVEFAGPVDVADASLLDLILSWSDQAPAVLPKVEIARTTISRELRIENAEIHELDVASLKVGGPTVLTNLNITGSASLEHATFETLGLANVAWPADPDSTRLDGIGFDHVSAGDDNGSWTTLLSWLNRARYSGTAYSSLEQFFEASGQGEWADEVYIARRERERELKNGWGRFWDGILYWLVDYGRSPELALIWSLPFLLAGHVAFAQSRGMEPKKREDADQPYSVFWYTLDLFLPFIDLQAADTWQPNKDRTGARIYMRLHTIAGWVLIPVGLAAFTGIVN